MKKFTIHTLAPALALLVLGCSSPTAMQSTEYDDMYYSSSDKTQYVEPEATTYSEQSETNREARRQEYSGSSNSITDDYYAEEYYDGRDYNPRDNWYRPNYSYVDPYWGSAYTPRHYAYSRYSSAFYDPFFDPFYADPFFHDPFYRRPYWNNGISIAISYNYGWGNWGRPYPFYSRWYPNNPYYHGYYGGAYNNFYGNSVYYDRPIVIGNRVKTQYGPRDARGAVVTEGTRGNGGRPNRGEAYQGDVTGTENARPSRSSNAAVGAESDNETKSSLPARPSRTEYYDPSQGRSRTTRQPVNVGEQQGERYEAQPRQRNTRTREYTPTQRSTESRQRVRQNYEPQQERPRPIERKSSLEQRRESPTPTRSEEMRRESSSNSSSSSSGSRSGRPTRGQ